MSVSGPEDEPEEAATGEDAGAEGPDSLFAEVGSLIEDGKTYASAELAFQKTRLAYVLAHAKWIAILGGIAAVLVVMSVFTLVFGLLMALIPILTPVGATLAVTFSMLVTAIALGFFAKLQLRKIMTAFEAEEE